MEMEKERLHILDILKGLAIIFVIFSHYGWTNNQRIMMLFPFWIDMAVPIFMIISGYVNSLSYKNKKINELYKMYNYKNIMEKILRYTIPFFLVYLIEILCQIVINEFSFKYLIFLFFIGGLGPGSYYYPIMIQFIFIFPIVYKMIKKYDIYGFVGCFALNFAFEFLQHMFNMPTGLYRLLLFRYIGLIAFGCYLIIGKKEISRKIKIISFFIGVTWIILICYIKYDPFIINREWARTSFVSAFYIMPIFSLIFNKMKNRKNALVETIGKASFNIFLTQMVYFNYFEYLIEGLFSDNALFINGANILICVFVGLVFYYIENKITKRIISYLRNNNYFEKNKNVIN